MRQFLKEARDWFRSDPEHRNYIYLVAQAALAVAVVHGVLTAAYASVWLALIAVVLQVARKNLY